MTLPDREDDPSFYDHLVEKRFLAWVIDLGLTLLIVLTILVLTLGLALIALPVIWSAVAIAYRTVMLSRFGATAGMLVAAIRLRRLDGRVPDATLCLWHSVIYALSMVFVVPQIVSVAMMMTTPFRQGLNDLVLGTTMINRALGD